MIYQSTDGRSSRAAVAAWLITVLAVCVLVWAATVTVGAATATGEVATNGATNGTAANATTLDVGDAAVGTGGNATVRVSLDRVPTGLAGFEVTLSLDAADVATITGARYPDGYRPTTDPAIGESGRTVTLEAADLGETVEPGAADVTLAFVTLSGAGNGTAALDATGVQVDADDGSRVDPTVDAGTVGVGASASDVASGASGDGGGPQGPDGNRFDAASVPGGATGLGLGALVLAVGVGVLVRRD